MKLDQARAKAFHNITAKGIYVAKRARPDISFSIAFLTTRVKGPSLTIGASSVIWLSISAARVGYH